MNSVKSVDDYISQAPSDLQKRLRDIRQTIKSVAPQAEEKISYSMPYYGYKGRLAYFAYARHHIGLYIPPPVFENHAKELKAYKTAKATVQFPHIEKLPLDLIKKLVKARMAINEKK